MSVDADPRDEPSVGQLRRLADIGRALSNAPSLEAVATLTVERGTALVGALAALVMLSDVEGALHVRATHGIPDERLGRFGAPTEPDVAIRLQGLLGVPDDALLAVPLVAGGVLTGIVAVAFTHVPTAGDEWLLSALADMAAVALENARLGGEVRLEMEGRLRTSEGATNAKERALASLAHDIRTPLGAIEGYSGLMDEGLYGPVTEQQREAIGRVRMSGRHLLSLLDNVLDMARLDAGFAPVPPEPIALGSVAREAVEILTPAADEKAQTLRLVATGSVIASGDTARLRQVLVNLLGNAVKFTPRGGSITVRTGTATADDVTWGEIVVTDTGPGIAPSEQAAVFEAYYRSPQTATLPGVGLGLAISQGLVAGMGGTLELSSEPGAGATFTLRLPLVAHHPDTRA